MRGYALALLVLASCDGAPGVDGGRFDAGRAVDAGMVDAFVREASIPDAFVPLDGELDAAIGTVEELAYDDGVATVYAIPDIGTPGGQIAVRFTPSAYPAALRSARFFIGPVGVPTTAFRVRVYAPDASGMVPGSELLSADVRGAATAGNEWVSVDLSSYGISVDSGDFFVAMEWLMVPGPMFMNPSQHLGEDETEPDGRSWYHNTTQPDWMELQAFPNPVDAMIRATVVSP